MERLIFTYFIQDELGNIKIGKSINPEKRFIESQVGNALKLTLILYIFGDKEKQLHQKFDFYRIRNGEWFKPNKQLTRFINSKMNGFEVLKEKRKFHDSKIDEQAKWYESIINHRKEIEIKENQFSW